MCESVCLFSMGCHRFGPIALKFGMEDHIYPGEVIGYILLMYPYPLGWGTYPLGWGRPKSCS